MFYLIIFLSFISLSLFLLATRTNVLNNFSKEYIMLGYFIVYPLVSGLIPDIDMGFYVIKAQRIFLLFSLVLTIMILIKKSQTFRASKITVYLFIYYLYLVVSSILMKQFVDSELIDYFLPIGFLLLMENIEYNVHDLERFNKYLLAFSVLIIIGTLIQLTVDSQFFLFKDKNVTVAYGEVLRNTSIFINMGSNDGKIAIGFIAIIILFMNFYKSNILLKIFALLTAFCAFATFSRYIWLMYLIAIIYFINYKFQKKKFFIYPLISLVIFLLYISLYDAFQNTDLFQYRVAAETYKTRFLGPDIFIKHIFPKNIVFGFGHWSGLDDLHRYGRHTLHNGILDILFRGGIVGAVFFSLFLLQIYRKGKIIAQKTKNPIFILFVVIWIAINLTAGFKDITYYGYFLMILYLNMYSQLYLKQTNYNHEYVPQVIQ